MQMCAFIFKSSDLTPSYRFFIENNGPESPEPEKSQILMPEWVMAILNISNNGKSPPQSSSEIVMKFFLEQTPIILISSNV